jgi:hypothetical protein
MTGRDVPERSGQQVVVGIEVDIGEVGQRDAARLGADHDRHDRGVEVVHAAHPVVGPVEADRPAATVTGRSGVEAVAAPDVVRLPGRDRHDQCDRAAGRGRGDDVGDLVLPARRTPQAEDVEPGVPARRVGGQAHVPRGHDGPGAERLEHRLCLLLTGDHSGPLHEVAGAAVVVTDPVGIHPEGALGGRHLELERGPGRRADPGRVGLDLPVLGRTGHPPGVGPPQPHRRPRGASGVVLVANGSEVDLTRGLRPRGRPVIQRPVSLAGSEEQGCHDAERRPPGRRVPHRATTSSHDAAHRAPGGSRLWPEVAQGHGAAGPVGAGGSGPRAGPCGPASDSRRPGPGCYRFPSRRTTHPGLWRSW